MMHTNLILVYLHVLSGMVWVGGMIALLFAIRPALQNFKARAEPGTFLDLVCRTMLRFFWILKPAILFLILTGIWMAVNRQYSGTSLIGYVHAKYTVWLIMTGIFGYGYSRLKFAQKRMQQGDFPAAEKAIRRVQQTLLPLNIGLGLIALYLGIKLRGL